EIYFCYSSRTRHTRSKRDWSSDVCSSDLKSGKREAPQVEKLQPAYVKIRNEELTTYKVGSGAQPFTDEAYSIKNVATELKGLKEIGRASCRERRENTEKHAELK